ncbi:MAG: agmatine deiminase family protein [Candidatus Gracilibacteria bacterium]
MKYKMPAEWEPHEGTWLSWPHNESHWPGKFELIPPVFANIARELSAAGEKVFICVNDEAMEKSARKLIGKAAKNIFFFRIPTNTSWARDHGPIFVYAECGKRMIEDWIFNTWGGKYPPWDKDDVVPQKIGEIFKIPVITPAIVMEGGSIDVNGEGTVLTTEQCLLNKNRNPHLTKEQIEKYLADYLGATNVLWLKEGIIGDDTDGHIDDIARFTDAKTVVCPFEENKKDENCEILKKNFEDLKKMKDQAGELLNVVKIPMPDPVIHEGQRLPASYVNFYIANKAVLVPTFNCPKDAEAISVLQKLFPTRKIVGIDCTDLVWGLGTIHCSTQQQPV